MASGRPSRRRVAGRNPRGGLWRDRERRRALLLSLLLHAGVLLGVVWLYVAPSEPEPEPLILELTPPQGGAPETAAAATDTPAPQAAAPEVAGNAAQNTPAPETPASESETVQPVAPTELADAPPPSEQAPPARVPAPPAPATALPAEPPAATLPDIEAVEVAPQPPQRALELPAPNPEVAVTPERRVAVTPQVLVPPSEPLPAPAVTAELAQQELALPQAEAEVAPEGAVPQPDVTASAARAVPEPQARAGVSAVQALPQPTVSADVASRTVPEPQAGAAVTQAQTLPQPSASSTVAGGESVPRPQAAATVAQAQSLAVTPGVALSDAVPVVTPEATANVAPQAVQATDAGDGAQSTQPGAAQTAEGQGAASDGSGAAPTGVANVQSFAVTLEQPLAVLIDNADAAYPQQGLVQASSVFEMPVEGGLTRLMSIYTRNDPAQVGPIRSARDYFLEAALAMNGTLVHVGGAPSVVSRIASQNLPTLDALQDAALFAQAPGRAAPHSTFSTGTILRDAVGRLPNQVSGTLYTPPGDAPDVSTVSVGYSAEYSSGFRYLPEIDQYRWLRSGQEATDTTGEAVAADAVVVARVVAFPYPDDPEGRLYLPYSGGEATLYLRGKAISGSWTSESGFTFISAAGTEVDLTPFKRWILFAPEEAEVSTG